MMILYELLRKDIMISQRNVERLVDSGDIYLSKYSGWYSVSDEAYYDEDEIINKDNKKISKSSGSSVDWVEEESYFLNYQNGKINF